MIQRQLLTFSLLAAILPACAAATDSASEEQSVAEPRSQRPMATVELADGRQVAFHDHGMGFSIEESAPADAASPWAVTADMRQLSLLEIYQQLVPAGASVPDVIREADARYKAAAARYEATTADPTASLSPPNESSGAGEGPALYTDEQQQWFRDTFCTSRYLHECIQGYSWASSNWAYGRWYWATGYANSGAQPSTLSVYRWDSGQPVLAGSAPMGDNYVWRLSFYWSEPTYWRAYMADVGAVQLSLATEVTSVLKTGPRR